MDYAIALIVLVGVVGFGFATWYKRSKKSQSPVSNSTDGPSTPDLDELPKLRELDVRASGLVARVRRTLAQPGISPKALEDLASDLVLLRNIQEQLVPLILSAHAQTLRNQTVAKSLIKESASISQQLVQVSSRVEQTLHGIHLMQAAQLLDELGKD